MNEIPSEIVTEYVMNPATEDLLPNGRQLENGMVVLIEDNFIREQTYAHETLESVHYLKRARILETSRWCKVSDIEIDGKVIRFVGIYADGTKALRRYNKSFAWFVKKQSSDAYSVERLRELALRELTNDRRVHLLAVSDLLEVHDRGGISLENFGSVGKMVNMTLRAYGLPHYTPNGA